MKKIFLSSVLIVNLLMAADCSYSAGTAKVSWKAFKTYEKIGVGGTFDRASMTSASNDTIEGVLTGSSVAISTLSVNSGNSARDAKLSDAFFKVQGVTAINAKIVSAKAGKAMVEISMNGVTKSIPMTYTVSDTSVIGKGVIDLADFSMLPSLGSINKACYELHAGKTWQDVEIGFEIMMEKKCS